MSLLHPNLRTTFREEEVSVIASHNRKSGVESRNIMEYICLSLSQGKPGHVPLQIPESHYSKARKIN